MPLAIRPPSECPAAKLTLIDALATGVMSLLMLAAIRAPGEGSPTNAALEATGSTNFARGWSPPYRGNRVVPIGV